MKKSLSLFICYFVLFQAAFGQGSKDIRLVVTGEAETKDAAITQALRSAIEMSFGTFVSANTTILNDDVVKDEVATISSGNIKSYKELGCVSIQDGYSVTLEAVVSLDNLISYAKSKGSSCEFAGQSFAMNLKIKELNRQNEISAMQNLKNQMALISEDMFDVRIEALDPSVSGSGYKVPLKISLSLNEAACSFYQILTNTLSSISIGEIEYDEYKKANIPTYKVELSTLLNEYGHCCYIYEYVFRDKSTEGIIKQILRLPFNGIYYEVQYTDHTESVRVPGNSFKMSQEFPLVLLKKKAPVVEAAESEMVSWYLQTIKALKKEKKKEEAKAMEKELSDYRRRLASYQSYSSLEATDIDIFAEDELTKERNRSYGHITKYRNSPGDQTIHYSTYYWNTNDTGAPNTFISFNYRISKAEATDEIRSYFDRTRINPLVSVVIDYQTRNINDLKGFSVSKKRDNQE